MGTSYIFSDFYLDLINSVLATLSNSNEKTRGGTIPIPESEFPIPSELALFPGGWNWNASIGIGVQKS